MTNSKRGYKLEDYLGKTIGGFTVTGPETFRRNGRSRYWGVRCKCGREFEKSISKIVAEPARHCATCRAISQRGPGNPLWKGGKFLKSTFLNTYRWGARKRGFAFDITVDDVEDKFYSQDCKCAFSGERITIVENQYDYSHNMSIDRIDNGVGYTPDNIQIVSKDINIMRGTLDKERFIELCKMVAENCKDA